MYSEYADKMAELFKKKCINSDKVTPNKNTTAKDANVKNSSVEVPQLSTKGLNIIPTSLNMSTASHNTTEGNGFSEI